MKGAGGKSYREGESWLTGSSLKRERMRLYLEWLATPASQRLPRSKKEFASSLGVDVSTLYKYERDPWFQKEFQRLTRGLFKVEKAQRVVDTLFEIATDPLNRNAVSAARTLLEWMDKTHDAEQGIDLSELSEEELLDLAKMIYEQTSD